MFLLKNIWLILFILWGLPLTFYRSKFRKLVYQTDKWTINIKPYFMRELKALFGNMYPENKNYLKLRNFYRFYLIIYLLLFTSYLTFSQKNNMNVSKSEVPSRHLHCLIKTEICSTLILSSVKRILLYIFIRKMIAPDAPKRPVRFAISLRFLRMPML